MKKIAIIGTHGVGKTTLCGGLKTYITKQGKRSIIVSENVRNCPLPIHNEQGLATTQWIIGRQMQAEMEAILTKPDYIICDRSILDPLVYMLYNSPNFLTDELFAYLKDYSLGYHSMWIVRPTTRSIVKDGFRDTDKDYQYSIHSLFMAMVAERAHIIDSDEIFAANPLSVFDDDETRVVFSDESLCKKILGEV